MGDSRQKGTTVIGWDDRGLVDISIGGRFLLFLVVGGIVERSRGNSGRWWWS